MKVADLVLTESGQWNEELLLLVFGDDTARKIMMQVPPPTLTALIPDRLIWTRSKKGKYTASEGYKMLTTQEGPREANALVWSIIWKQCWVLPKIKTFLWRACHNGLPTAHTLHRRIEAIRPVCQRCEGENEFLMHLLFFCPGSRAVWHASRLTLRVEHLPLEFKRTLMFLAANFDSEALAYICNILWAIWKGRNDVVMGSKSFNPISVVRQANSTPIPDKQLSGMKAITAYQIPLDAESLLIDASWDTQGHVGTAWQLFSHSRRLMAIGFHSLRGPDATWAEAMAIQHAMCYWAHGAGRGAKVICFTDCKNIVEVLNTGNFEASASWRATPVIMAIKKIMDDSEGAIGIQYVQREVLGGPHRLANAARNTGESFQGMPDEGSRKQHDIQLELCSEHFKCMSSEI